EQALVEILKKKQAHVPLQKSAERPVAPKNVINLMDALRKSIGDKAKAPAQGKAPAKAPAQGKKKKKAEGQREMLLPIAGKKPKDSVKDVAKESAKGGVRRKAG